MKKFFSLFFIVVAGAGFAYFSLGFVKIPEIENTILFNATTTATQTKSPIPAVATSTLKVSASAAPVKQAETPSVSVKTVEKKTDIPNVSDLSLKPNETTPNTDEPLTYVSPKFPSGGIVREDEVLSWTNYYRAKEGLPLLARNSQLDAAALVKAKDMFARQYFEHVSPSGEDGADLITAAGYDYLLMGENLAEGNFSDAKDLVDAWMASPGHRANILKPQFDEIGISAIEGTYQGRRAWMSVQEFGRPTSDCPLPSESAKMQIDNDKTELEVLIDQADAMKAEMDALKHDEKYEEYNDLVPVYNELVGRISELSQKVRSEVNDYNVDVQSYNTCAAQ
ncbi:MAG: CAP domain-containing protein [Candidatus Paceibacterota bacterium]|jgi:uncharacterized protein YkwD|nr:CAP domain-containing protein [Candidatus Paceibacterota bacterium]